MWLHALVMASCPSKNAVEAIGVNVSFLVVVWDWLSHFLQGLGLFVSFLAGYKVGRLISYWGWGVFASFLTWMASPV